MKFEDEMGIGFVEIDGTRQYLAYKKVYAFLNIGRHKNYIKPIIKKKEVKEDD